VVLKKFGDAMSFDRQQIDTIKLHFAGKSSDQLQEIVEDPDEELWSPEAITAAAEVLEERRRGRAQEPLLPVEDPPPPRLSADPYSLAFLAVGLLGGLGGPLHFHVHGFHYLEMPEPDLPIAFGPRLAWLAIDSRDTDAVANALGLVCLRPATWAEGIAAARQSASIFVTPPLAD
jgi:hypothetical protein